MTDATTVLVITGPGVPPYSARGLTQTLNPIEASSQLVRDVNGDLVDVSAEKFRKYESTISCEDVQTPALDGWWPGMTVTVDCAAELSYLTAAGYPSRTVVESRDEGDFTFYRPRIVFKIRKIEIERNEYGAVTRWSLDLEEV